MWGVGAILIFGLFVFIGARSNTRDSGTQSVSYDFSQARVGDIEMVVSAVGQVQPLEQVDLQAVVAGDATDVVGVYVSNNEEVKEGQVLVALDSREAVRKVYNAELSLWSAQIEYDKTAEEYEDLTKDDRRARQTKEIALLERESSLTQAQETLADYQIKAPFDGLLTDLVINEGDSISRSDVFASVITSENKVVVSLNEVDALQVEVGNAVVLTFDALTDLDLSGTVSRVDTIGEAEQGVVSYNVEIDFNEQSNQLRPGMSVNAEITTQSVDDVLIVPNSAVKGFGDSAYVEQLVNGQVQKVPVTLGVLGDFYTQITGGISEGESVITGTVTQTEEESDSGSSSIFGGMRLPGTGGRPR